MENIIKIDDALHISCYDKPSQEEYAKIWNKLKNDSRFLKEAIKVKRDRFDERDTMDGLTIAESMLVNYDNVDKNAYDKLIKSIYSNVDIARKVVDGASNGGYSFLLMSLWNPNLKLTKEQKAFAVSEAMNMSGTVKDIEAFNQYEKMLDEKGVTDDTTVMLGDNPIGAKAANKYLYKTFSSLSNAQAHGTGEFDIRYYILRNPNWTLEEKKKLVMDFFEDPEHYDECLDQWEWAIINERVNFKGGTFSELDKVDLYDYTYDSLLEFYSGNKEITDKVWEEIQFCKTMHELRPMQYEQEFYEQAMVYSSESEVVS